MSRLSRATILAAATVFVGASALALAAYGPTGVSSEYQELREQELIKRDGLSSRVSHSYKMGEAFKLDGIGENDSEYESLKETYLSSLGWVGEIELSVSQFQVFQTAQATGIPELADYPSDDNFCYVTVAVEMHNVDATTNDTRFAGTDILVPNIRIYGSGFSEALDESEDRDAPDSLSAYLIFNDMEADQDVANNNLAIKLPVGESLVMNLCFEVAVYETSDGLRAAPCSLYFGDVYNIGFCRVDLGEVSVG